GISFSRTRQAQPLKSSDYAEYDLLVCMDGENVFNANRFFSGDPDAKIHLLLDYTNTPGREVADPWYSGDFETAYRDIMAGCQGLLGNTVGTEAGGGFAALGALSHKIKNTPDFRSIFY
ncbi:MAG: hypothetical protein OSJ64_08620, partial [Firmicutes bacterium]|nr:hypothetical protein [Bacillota bacterium]